MHSQDLNPSSRESESDAAINFKLRTNIPKPEQVGAMWSSSQAPSRGHYIRRGAAYSGCCLYLMPGASPATSHQPGQSSYWPQ